MYVRKTVLFRHEEPWMKNNRGEDFNVPMERHGVSENLVSIYFLKQVQLSKKRTVLDHKEMMFCVNSDICCDPALKERKAEIITIFKCFGLSISVATNLTSADYLDLDFDLTTNIYKPCRKPNDEPVYINKHYNHPLYIVQQIPLSASWKISNIILNQSKLNSFIPIYKEVLKTYTV